MRSIKETNFFAYEGEAERSCFMGDFESRDHFPIVTLAEYLALFNGASRKRAIGEASVLYLHSVGAAQRIRKFAPEAKLIAVLHHPVERAYWSYHLHVREGREPRTFEDAVRQEQAGVEDRRDAKSILAGSARKKLLDSGCGKVAPPPGAPSSPEDPGRSAKPPPCEAGPPGESEAGAA
jgi:hypothetical protein